MNIIRKATESQLTFLRNSGASFKVILADGEIVLHDPNGIIEPQAKKKDQHRRGPSRNPDAKAGEPSAYVNQYITPLEPGQTATIPCKYHPETMRSVVCNSGRRLFGSKNYMTEFNADRTEITILRVN